MDGSRNGLVRTQKVLVWASDSGEARELQDHIARLGWEVQYAEEQVTDPAKFLTESPVDVALLDTDLRKMKLSDWASACESHGVPLVLIKTYESCNPLDPTLKSARRVYKPIDGPSIRRTLTRAMQERTRNLIAQAADL